VTERVNSVGFNPHRPTVSKPSFQPIFFTILKNWVFGVRANVSSERKEETDSTHLPWIIEALQRLSIEMVMHVPGRNNERSEL
jgi:hypothetical protein